MRFYIAAVISLAAVACSQAQDVGEYARVVAFDTATIRVNTAAAPVALHVEVARTREQRTMGLMERTSLADTAGMLFLYDRDEPADAGFWMYRTRIPLDIAFLDSTGLVVAVRQMTPCTATLAVACKSYTPGVAYRAALEVNAGVLARLGISAGTRVELPASRQPEREDE